MTIEPNFNVVSSDHETRAVFLQKLMALLDVTMVFMSLYFLSFPSSTQTMKITKRKDRVIDVKLLIKHKLCGSRSTDPKIYETSFLRGDSLNYIRSLGKSYKKLL